MARNASMAAPHCIGDPLSQVRTSVKEPREAKRVMRWRRQRADATDRSGVSMRWNAIGDGLDPIRVTQGTKRRQYRHLGCRLVWLAS